MHKDAKESQFAYPKRGGKALEKRLMMRCEINTERRHAKGKFLGLKRINGCISSPDSSMHLPSWHSSSPRSGSWKSGTDEGFYGLYAEETPSLYDNIAAEEHVYHELMVRQTNLLRNLD